MSQSFPLEDGGSNAFERSLNSSDGLRVGMGESSRSLLSGEAALSLSSPYTGTDNLTLRLTPDSSRTSLFQMLGNLQVTDGVTAKPADNAGRGASLEAKPVDGTRPEARVVAGVEGPGTALQAENPRAETKPADVADRQTKSGTEIVSTEQERSAPPQLEPARVETRPAAIADQLPTPPSPEGRVGGRPADMRAVDSQPATADAKPVASQVPGQIRAGSLKTDRPIEALLNDGTFTASDRQIEKRMGDGKVSPLIKVGFQNHSGTDTMRPDFIVKQDGTIQVVGDPSKKLRQNDISIEVERGVGQLNPSDAQRAAVDELAGYLANRIKEQYPKDIKYGVKLSDTQNLVSAQAEKGMGARNASELGRLPEMTRRQVEDLNRFDGGGRGRMSRREADGYFPNREGVAPSETERLAAMKDVVAGFSTHRVKKPYENIGYRPERGRTVGRYGLGYDQISEWLESKSAQEFQSLERQGKLPAGAAERLSQLKQSVEMHKADPTAQLDPFLQKLKNPERKVPLTKQELRETFGKEVQELVATDMVRKYAWETLQKDGSVDVGKVALAMQLGHAPTETELKRGENRALMRAANQSYSLADSRYKTPGNQDIDWTDVNGRTLANARNAVGKVMWGDFANVVRGGRLGCAASVSKVLEHAGIYGIKSAGVKDFAHRAQQKGYERLPLSQARPGDIVYGLEPGSAQVGGRAHIGIVGTNGLVYHNRSSTGRWSEDGLNRVFNSGRFGRNLYVLRAPGSRG